MTRLRKYFRQRFCKHEGYLSDLVRHSDRRVTCPCLKCDKVLEAECGLYLPISWVPDARSENEKLLLLVK